MSAEIDRPYPAILLMLQVQFIDAQRYRQPVDARSAGNGSSGSP